MTIVDNVLSSCVKLYYVHVKYKRTNQICSPSKIIQLIKVEWHTCDRNGEQFFQWKQEKLWSFDKVRNILIEKKVEIYAISIRISTRYLSY